LDFEGALLLHESIPVMTDDAPKVYRALIGTIVERLDPPWLQLFCRGREAVVAALNADVKACFERSGALSQTPDEEVMKWLDELVSMAYARQDAGRLLLGRQAERLSFEYEQELLHSETDAPPIRWISLDDNTAGYDILSYVRTGPAFLPKRIEVKASSKVPPTIHVTRHEWEVAASGATSYVFHVWHLASRTLRQYTVDEVADHIPTERGDGRWETIEVRLSE
jgi:hypothetical protein